MGCGMRWEGCKGVSTYNKSMSPHLEGVDIPPSMNFTLYYVLFSVQEHPHLSSDFP